MLLRSLFGDVSLPVERNVVCRASYTLVGDPGAEGALIRFAHEELAVPGSPPIEINVTASCTMVLYGSVDRPRRRSSAAT